MLPSQSAAKYPLKLYQDGIVPSRDTYDITEYTLLRKK